MPSSVNWIRLFSHQPNNLVNPLLSFYPISGSVSTLQPALTLFGSRFIPRRAIATTGKQYSEDRSRLSISPLYPSRLSWPAHSWPMVHTSEDARVLALQLDYSGRQLLLTQLQEMSLKTDAQQNDEEERTVGSREVEPLTRSQLYRIFLYNGLPFIGFGILDNGIMIVAGEYIDVTIGVGLGISTMAAAALGNLVSDVAGVGTAGYVELLVSKLGVTPVELTTTQSLSRSVRWVVALGRGLGIAIGCLIGMSPLLFFKEKEEKKEKKLKDSTASPPTTTSSTK